MTRHPLDRSAAFTALLEFCPWFGRTESRAAEAVATRFLAAFYASGKPAWPPARGHGEMITVTGADRAIRYAAIGAVSMVALVAAFVSYKHALQVVRAHGESGALALAYPVTVDGLI